MVIWVNDSTLTRIFGAALIVTTMLLMTGCGEIYVHEEFNKLVMSKSEAEVTSIVGKPAAVDGSNPARVTWTYYGRTIDIENQNKRDAKTLVIFAPDAATQKLRVVEVKFERG